MQTGSPGTGRAGPALREGRHARAKGLSISRRGPTSTPSRLLLCTKAIATKCRCGPGAMPRRDASQPTCYHVPHN